ncbi:LysR family transcriptional regulator [Rhodobacter sp.]
MSLRLKLPSTGALFMFDAAAQHLNFTHAAREFNVTQPAISRTIGRLEAHLGVQLFRRLPGRLELTEAGLFLHRAIRDGFDRIESALAEIVDSNLDAQTVTLSVSSAFAIHCMMPRFTRLRESLPEIALRFELIHGEPVGRLGTGDLGIRHGLDTTEDLQHWPLTPEIVLPVCSPDYLARHGPLDPDAGLAGHSLACLMGNIRVPWEVYFARTRPGFPAPVIDRRVEQMSFPDYALVVQSALKGQTVALGWWHVVANELVAGGLVPASDSVLRTGDTYYLVAHGGGTSRPAVARVRDWLLAEFDGLRAETADVIAPG